jgi:drug/metabolite transporter (DMT)-like permease
MPASGVLALGPRDLLMLAILTLIWGVNWPVMKLGVQEFAPMSFRVLGMAGGLAYIYAVIKWRGLSLRLEKHYWREIFLLCLSNMLIWYVCSIYGIKLLTSGRAAILGYTLPIWTAIIGLVVYRQNPGARLWFGVFAALVGVLFLLASELQHMAGRPLGVFLMLLAAATWGWGTHLMRRRSPEIHVLVLMFWTLSIAFVFCVVVAIVLEHDQWVRWPNRVEWSAIAFNSFLAFGFAQIAWYRLATILPPVASGLSVMLIPVIGVFSAIWLVGEVPQWQDYAALACILVAIATVLLPTRSAKS